MVLTHVLGWNGPLALGGIVKWALRHLLDSWTIPTVLSVGVDAHRRLCAARLIRPRRLSSYKLWSQPATAVCARCNQLRTIKR